MELSIGISEKKLNAINELLSGVLANAVTLYIKTRKFHWNVAGESFMELHKLFEAQYKELEESIDEIAERIGKLGGKAIGTMEEYGKLSVIKEYPGKYPSSKEMIKELLEDHQTIIVHLRESVDQCANKFNDAGTADLLTGFLEEHETIAWTVRRYLNKF